MISNTVLVKSMIRQKEFVWDWLTQNSWSPYSCALRLIRVFRLVQFSLISRAGKHSHSVKCTKYIFFCDFNLVKAKDFSFVKQYLTPASMSLGQATIRRAGALPEAIGCWSDTWSFHKSLVPRLLCQSDKTLSGWNR